MTEWNRRKGEDWRNLGKITDVRNVLENEKVDEILICLPQPAIHEDIFRIINEVRNLGVVIRILPDNRNDNLIRHMHVEEFGNEYVLTLFREQMIARLLLKRLIDITVSLTLLLLMMPLIAIIAIAIKFTSTGPVIFKQRRVGMHLREFNMYKFRTMCDHAEEMKPDVIHFNERDGPAFKMERDPRVTTLGRLLRKTSIDELPQLINVLTGKMSLVGPRPPLPDEVNKYKWTFRKRLSMKPGITCIWQISGRNNIGFEKWMQMDYDYIDNWTLLTDIKILIKTIPAVFLGRGAS